MGGSRRERGFVAQYARRLRAPNIIDVRLLTPRNDAKVIWKDRPALWLVFITPNFKPDPTRYVSGQWHAMLIAGAVRDVWSAKKRGVRPVAGYTFNYAVGRDRFATIGAQPVQRRPERPAMLASESEVREVIDGNASAASLDIATLELERTLGVAPVISVNVENPNEFVSTLNDKIRVLVGDLLAPATIEGYYIEGRHDGELVETSVFATRLNASTGWINPKYR